jgi:hypothetical protein
MKTTLDLPDELMREMKLRALMQGRTLRDMVAEFLRQGLGMAPCKPASTPIPGSIVQVGAHGLPVIRCGDQAPAAGMSIEALLLLEQQALTSEDMQGAGRSV